MWSAIDPSAWESQLAATGQWLLAGVLARFLWSDGRRRVRDWLALPRSWKRSVFRVREISILRWKVSKNLLTVKKLNHFSLHKWYFSCFLDVSLILECGKVVLPFRLSVLYSLLRFLLILTIQLLSNGSHYSHPKIWWRHHFRKLARHFCVGRDPKKLFSDFYYN